MPRLPPIAEVAPISTITPPTMSQLQDTLTKVMAIVNAANKSSSSTRTKSTTAIPTLKLPGGKEVQIDVKPQQLKQTPPTDIGGLSIKQSVSPKGIIVSSNVAPTAQSKPSVNKPSLLVATPQASCTPAPILVVTTPSAPILSVMTPSTPPTQPLTTPSATGVTVTPSASKSRVATITGTKKQVLDPGNSSVANIKTAKSVKVAGQKKVPQTLRVLNLGAIELELKPVATKWRKLGRSLNFDDSNLQQIAASNGNDPVNCLSALLAKWNESKKSSATLPWKTLCKALGKDFVGEKVLAERLMEKYGSNVKIGGFAITHGHVLMLMCTYMTYVKNQKVYLHNQSQT